ncbi:MAG: peptidylprolyl isomerase [Nitrospinaceae bacterium]|nr:peptidylprolyl isomerase [Nitrospinaceae bacterium]NIR55496.1 peptidylprolyl isomerase [Nitrospinaceae bacterium]NIS85928.1 peptidylprolyl isomerase [Nitrospinaceae bacterium]NIT82776.1 peptidylprolyl isomerase [Nitrospinaceae bacterium]NIU44980.1 peptidylprolyl isomerase [Nitrospinaceae bacterium]
MRSIRVSHILLTTEDLAQTIHSMLREIDNQDLLYKTFERLAKKYSACGTRSKGGDLGFMEFNTNARELEEAAMETPMGQIGGPVKSKFGYHVFLVTEEEEMGDRGIDGINVGSLR